MDKEFEDKGNDDLEDLNNIIFTDTAEEAEQAEDIISSPAPTSAYNTSGGASAQPDSARGPEGEQAAGSAQPDSARGPEGEQAAGSAHQPTGGAYTFHRPEYNNASSVQGAPAYAAKPWQQLPRVESNSHSVPFVFAMNPK